MGDRTGVGRFKKGALTTCLLANGNKSCYGRYRYRLMVHLIKHQINHHSGDADVNPDGERHLCYRFVTHEVLADGSSDREDDQWNQGYSQYGVREENGEVERERTKPVPGNRTVPTK